MTHLVQSYANASCSKVIEELQDAHAHLAASATGALTSLQHTQDPWGSRMKRLTVDLGADRPVGITKQTERLVEVINMAATLERLLDALQWFATQDEFAGLTVLHCHPSTSSARDANDLILGTTPGHVQVRVEVTDVVSGSAGQNGKELKDLRNLGCEKEVPSDGVRRFICTSAEFAVALAAPGRKWTRRHYRYVVTHIGAADTRLLEILAAFRREAT